MTPGKICSWSENKHFTSKKYRINEIFKRWAIETLISAKLVLPLFEKKYKKLAKRFKTQNLTR